MIAVHWLLVAVGLLSGLLFSQQFEAINRFQALGTDLWSDFSDFLRSDNSRHEYHPDMLKTLNSSLHEHIKGQEGGIDSIIRAFADWEFQKQSGVLEPLVLAVTGPTGVGKSETAFRIGEALFTRSSSHNGLPEGLLVLRGEDFASTSEDGGGGNESGGSGVAEFHRNIKQQVIRHIERCRGNAVIVFDEIQKVAPGVMEVLMPALEERGSLSETTYVTPLGIENVVHSVTNSVKSLISRDNYNQIGGRDSRWTETSHPVTKRVRTSNCVFIFISDIGSEVMTKLLLVYGNRNNLPRTILRNEVKTALDSQWTRLKFGKLIKDVVPFLPLEPPHIKLILEKKINMMNAAMQFSKWYNLLVDDEVLDYLVSPAFVKYSFHFPKVKNSNSNVGNNNPGNINKQQQQQQTVQITASGSTGGSVSTNNGGVVPDSSSSRSSSNTADGDVNSDTTTPPAPAVPRIFATWGARSLDNAGPLQDLRSMLHRFAQPWRPASQCQYVHILTSFLTDQTLHVGVLNDSPESNIMRNRLGVPEDAQNSTMIYFQWCEPVIDARVSRHQRDSDDPVAEISVTSRGNSQSLQPQQQSSVGERLSLVKSDNCETVWFGAFPS